MEKQIEAKVKPEEQKRHLIKAYLDDEEYEKFQLFAKACKCTNSNLVRQLLAGAHLVAFPPDEYMRLSSEFVKIGININQIARIANLFKQTVAAECPKACIIYGLILASHLDSDTKFTYDELIVCKALVYVCVCVRERERDGVKD